MADFMANFKNSTNETSCPKCMTHEDSQEESFCCKEIFKHEENHIKYEELFQEEISAELAKTITTILNARK